MFDSYLYTPQLCAIRVGFVHACTDGRTNTHEKNNATCRCIIGNATWGTRVTTNMESELEFDVFWCECVCVWVTIYVRLSLQSCNTFDRIFGPAYFESSIHNPMRLKAYLRAVCFFVCGCVNTILVRLEHIYAHACVTHAGVGFCGALYAEIYGLHPQPFHFYVSNHKNPFRRW